MASQKFDQIDLQILGELAQLFSEREMRSALTSAPDAAAAQRLITEWEPHAPSQRRAAV